MLLLPRLSGAAVTALAGLLAADGGLLELPWLLPVACVRGATAA